MSTLQEKKRAIAAADEFLRDLLNAKTTPRVPMAIRVRAQRVLRHLPTAYDINEPNEPTGKKFRFKPEVYDHLAPQTK
jgi:hypothetical protein